MEKLRYCRKCGKYIGFDDNLIYADETNLCWTCMKKMQLKDERDADEDPYYDQESEAE